MVTTPVLTGERARPARNARYLLACAASLVLWYGINFWPGWHSVPILSVSTNSILSLVNLWLLAAAVSNAVYIVFDAKWFKSAWQVLVTTTAIAVAARAYVEFPFDFSMFYYYDFRWLARLALMLAVVGGLIRLVVVGIRFVRATMRAVDDYLWTRQVRSTIAAKTYMASLTRPVTTSAFTAAGPSSHTASWDNASDGIARAIADNPATSTLARFAELGGVLEDEAAETAPAPRSRADAAASGGGETRRSRRAHASATSPKFQLPRLRRRKTGSHSAR